MPLCRRTSLLEPGKTTGAVAKQSIYLSRGVRTREPSKKASTQLKVIGKRQISTVVENSDQVDEAVGNDPDLPVYEFSSVQPEVSRKYIRSVVEACNELECVAGPVGFDMEWRVPWRGMPPRPVAVVQIASQRKVFIIQTSAMRGVFPRKLREILEDETIPKVGVNVQGDAKKLFKDHGVKIQNLVELSLMMRQAATEMPPKVDQQGRKLVSLKEQARFYLQKTLVKNEARIGDWERILDSVQLDYAANDAHCSISLYYHYLELSKASGNPLDHSLFTANVSLDGELTFEAKAAPSRKQRTKKKESVTSADDASNLCASGDTTSSIADKGAELPKKGNNQATYADIIEILDSESEFERDLVNVSTKLQRVVF
ncbi:hypothetical protein FRC17_000808 [Serendipita sp. 399]|nr:hypothetical protein FRC17_000808 [Serendipita sp. 399]